jgi:hypothetical protein
MSHPIIGSPRRGLDPWTQQCNTPLLGGELAEIFPASTVYMSSGSPTLIPSNPKPAKRQTRRRSIETRSQ